MGWQTAHTRTHSRAKNVERQRVARVRDVRWSRASARVLSDKSVWGGSPIGGPARRHCAKAELARRARSGGEGSIVNL